MGIFWNESVFSTIQGRGSGNQVSGNIVFYSLPTLYISGPLISTQTLEIK
jgi:hypothetical protein